MAPRTRKRNLSAKNSTKHGNNERNTQISREDGGERDFLMQEGRNSLLFERGCRKRGCLSLSGVLPWESAQGDLRGTTKRPSQEREDLEIAQESLRNS